MSDDSGSAQQELLDEALRDAIQLRRPGCLVVGWSIFVEYIDPEIEAPNHSLYTVYQAEGQQTDGRRA